MGEKKFQGRDFPGKVVQGRGTGKGKQCDAEVLGEKKIPGQFFGGKTKFFFMVGKVFLGEKFFGENHFSRQRFRGVNAVGADILGKACTEQKNLETEV